MSQHTERMRRVRQQIKMGLRLQFADEMMRPSKGHFIFDMRDGESGEQLVYFEQDKEALDA